MRRPFAGDPEILEMITDNPWTRTWNNLVTDVAIRPVERMVIGLDAAADDTKVRLARMLDEMGMAMAQTDGVLPREEAMRLQNIAAKTGLRPEALLEVIAAARSEVPAQVEALNPLKAHEARTEYISNALDKSVKYKPGHSAVSREKTGMPDNPAVDDQADMELRDAMYEGDYSRAYSKAGEIARQYVIGSPLAAYGVGAAGLYGGIQGLASLLGGNEAAPPEEGAGKKEKRQREAAK